MENTANLGLFARHNIISEYAERIYAYIHGEDAKRHKTVYTVSLLIINNNVNFNFLWDGLSLTVACYCPFKARTRRIHYIVMKWPVDHTTIRSYSTGLFTCPLSTLSPGETGTII
jgi:hypothetical protein